jgi:hypothetical protein
MCRAGVSALFCAVADNEWDTSSMFLNSWPIRFLITRAARAYGFLDPVNLVAKIRGFAEPSEFAEPLELLRAGMLFHARGLVNTKAIQNNLDWVWPYWVERQFNPADESFIPRAFSFSHINLTHRNWTAVGLPDVPYYPIVDPRGLVTPLFDGWSLDFWLVPENGPLLLPSKLVDPDFTQSLVLKEELHVQSKASWDNGASLLTDVQLCLQNHEPHCCIQATPGGLSEGRLAVALRPYNPEGISFIEKISLTADGCGWRINNRNTVLFDRQPERIILARYKDGDASQRLHHPPDSAKAITDDIGMATAVALFNVRELGSHPLEVRAAIYNELEPKKLQRTRAQETSRDWQYAVMGAGDAAVQPDGDRGRPRATTLRFGRGEPRVALTRRGISRALHLQAVLVP